MRHNEESVWLQMPHRPNLKTLRLRFREDQKKRQSEPQAQQVHECVLLFRLRALEYREPP